HLPFGSFGQLSPFETEGDVQSRAPPTPPPPPDAPLPPAPDPLPPVPLPAAPLPPVPAALATGPVHVAPPPPEPAAVGPPLPPIVGGHAPEAPSMQCSDGRRASSLPPAPRRWSRWGSGSTSRRPGRIPRPTAPTSTRHPSLRVAARRIVAKLLARPPARTTQ